MGEAFKASVLHPSRLEHPEGEEEGGEGGVTGALLQQHPHQPTDEQHAEDQRGGWWSLQAVRRDGGAVETIVRILLLIIRKQAEGSGRALS